MLANTQAAETSWQTSALQPGTTQQVLIRHCVYALINAADCNAADCKVGQLQQMASVQELLTLLTAAHSTLTSIRQHLSAAKEGQPCTAYKLKQGKPNTI